MRRALLTVLVGIVALSCAGSHARTSSLIPAMQMTWPGVREDAVLGAPSVSGADAAIVEMDQAMEEGSRDAILLVPWGTIRSAATVGISARVAQGQVSEGVAESLRERLRSFNVAIELLGGGY